MARQICFQDDATICTVGSMVNELLNAMQSGGEVTVDLSAVERVDTAALQILVAARKEADLYGTTVTYLLSDTVRTYAASVGITL